MIHDDPEWVEALVRRLTTKHESTRSEPWSPDDSPEAFFRGQLRAIVGVEVPISRIEAKFKLSQNRSEADMEGVIEGLTRESGDAVAEAMRTVLETKAG